VCCRHPITTVVAMAVVMGKAAPDMAVVMVMVAGIAATAAGTVTANPRGNKHPKKAPALARWGFFALVAITTM
jgi:putative effector of murein hydrolase